MKNEMNLTMLTDFYEFTMMNGFLPRDIRIKLHISICFSDEFPKTGVLP